MEPGKNPSVQSNAVFWRENINHIIEGYRQQKRKDEENVAAQNSDSIRVGTDKSLEVTSTAKESESTANRRNDRLDEIAEGLEAKHEQLESATTTDLPPTSFETGSEPKETGGRSEVDGMGKEVDSVGAGLKVQDATDQAQKRNRHAPLDYATIVKQSNTQATTETSHTAVIYNKTKEGSFVDAVEVIGHGTVTDGQPELIADPHELQSLESNQLPMYAPFPPVSSSVETPTTSWLGMDEKQIKQELKSIGMLIRSISKEISVEKLPITGDLEKEGQYSKLYHALDGVMLWNSPNLLEAPAMTEQAGLLLNSLLAHTIYAELLKDPFTFVGKVDANLRALMSQYRSVGADDAKGAHAWRTETLRTFYAPSGESEDDEVILRSRKFNQRVASLARNKAKNFLDSSAAYLIDDTRLEALQLARIHELFLKVAKIACNLWTSKTWPEVVDSSLLLGSIEAHDSALMTLHPFVTSNGNKNDLTSRQIGLVIHPLLLIYGTDDGDKYDEYRVLMPAEVWCPDVAMVDVQVEQQ